MSALFPQISCSSDESVPAYYPYQNRKYCGTKKSMTLSYSNCDSSLVVNFVTDSSVAHGGFQLRYTITSSGKCPVFSKKVCYLSFIHRSNHPPIAYTTFKCIHSSNHSSINN